MGFPTYTVKKQERLNYRVHSKIKSVIINAWTKRGKPQKYLEEKRKSNGLKLQVMSRKSYFISLKRSVRSQEVREMKKESVIIL